MCDCIDKVTENARKTLREKVESERAKVHEWIEEGDFLHKGFNLSGGPTKIGMPFVIEYRIQKTNGEPAQNVTKRNVSLYPSFCPFCGKKYDK